MPLTGRSESFAPARFAEKVSPDAITARTGRRRLNYGTHFALGTMWGAAFGVAAAKGLRGPKAVGAVFGTVYTGDVVLNTALGLYKPGTWSGKDWAVDVGRQAGPSGSDWRRSRPPRRPGTLSLRAPSKASAVPAYGRRLGPPSP